MNSEPRAEELIQKYVDGLLTAQEVDELQQLLIDDSTIADAFYAAARQEEQLRGYFREQRDSARIKSILDEVTASLPDRATLPVARQRVPTWQWCGAACVLLAVGIVSYFAFLGHDLLPSELPHEVIAGRVRVDGVATARLADDATFDIVGQVAGVIQLADGSRAELAPESRATIRSQVGGVRQLVTLHRGSGRFIVEKGDSQFRVETPAGAVTALGTEFTVEVVSDDGKIAESADRDQKSALVVGVIAGRVEVDFANETFPLGLGDDRIFASAPSQPDTDPDLVGKVVSVSDDFRLIHIEIKKTLENPHRHIAIQLGDDTELSWVNIPVNQQEPSLGYRASVWLAKAGGDEVAAAVRFSAEKGSGPPADLTGRVVDVANHARSITLELPRFTKSKSSAPDQPSVGARRVQLDEQTDTEYFFVPYYGEQPIIGYNATVWLRPGSSDVAHIVHFAGNKRGNYRPDLHGYVVDVDDDGRAIEIVHRKRKSVLHPDLDVTRIRLNIGRRVRLFYRDLPPAEQQLAVGHYAEVWMSRDEPKNVEAVRFRPGPPRQQAKANSADHLP